MDIADFKPPELPGTVSADDLIKLTAGVEMPRVEPFQKAMMGVLEYAQHQQSYGKLTENFAAEQEKLRDLTRKQEESQLGTALGKLEEGLGRGPGGILGELSGPFANEISQIRDQLEIDKAVIEARFNRAERPLQDIAEQTALLKVGDFGYAGAVKQLDASLEAGREQFAAGREQFRAGADLRPSLALHYSQVVPRLDAQNNPLAPAPETQVNAPLRRQSAISRRQPSRAATDPQSSTSSLASTSAVRLPPRRASSAEGALPGPASSAQGVKHPPLPQGWDQRIRDARDELAQKKEPQRNKNSPRPMEGSPTGSPTTLSRENSQEKKLELSLKKKRSFSPPRG